MFRGLGLDVTAGEVVAVLGRSGKSTMLRCVNLLETPTSGSIRVDGLAAFSGGKAAKGRDLVALRRRAGMLFQTLNVFPHLSVVENMALAMVRSLGAGKEEAVNTALRLLGKVGLADTVLMIADGRVIERGPARQIAQDPREP